MIYLLSSWLLWLIVCYGLGNGFCLFYRNFLHYTENTELLFFQKIWLGFVILTACLLFFSIFFPILLTISIILIILSLPGLAASFIFLFKRRINHENISSTLGIVLTCGGTFLIVAYICSAYPIRVYDTGLYHLNMVQWIKEHPVVPGLGNLHGRLAFNSSFHVFAAATDFWIWEGLSARIAAGFIFSLSASYWLWNIFFQKFNVLSSVFLFLTLGYFTTTIQGTKLPGLSTDIIIAVVSLVLFYELITNLQKKVGHLVCAYIFSLSTLIITIKLSGLALGTMAAFVSCIFFLKHNPGHRHLFFIALILPLFLGTGHIIRGIYLSGWLLYPVPWGDLGLVFTIPKDALLVQIKWVESWAKLPGKHYQDVIGFGFAHWFNPWVQNLRGSLPLNYMFFSFLATFSWIIIVINKKSIPTDCFVKISLLLCGYIAFGYWFITAPDFRFGYFLVFILFGITTTVLFSETFTSRLLSGDLFKVIVACWLFFNFSPSMFFPTTNTILHRPHQAPSLNLNDYEKIEIMDLHNQTGVIYKPKSGDQCWKSPLPCTPYAHDFIYIDNNDIGKGFKPVGKYPGVSP